MKHATLATVLALFIFNAPFATAVDTEPTQSPQPKLAKLIVKKVAVCGAKITVESTQITAKIRDCAAGVAQNSPAWTECHAEADAAYEAALDGFKDCIAFAVD